MKPPRQPNPSDWVGFADGSHGALYEILGAHRLDERDWVVRVWAPNAHAVSVVGDHDGWCGAEGLMSRLPNGVWESTITATQGGRYKFRVDSSAGIVDKADPFAFHAEAPPATASVLWDLSYEWADDAWLSTRAETQRLDQPISVYELHLGSWDPGEEGISYRSIAPRLAAHVERCGFTHVELLPVMEHPFYGSWGYQTTGYFAASCRYGSPQDLMYLIDFLHRHNIGVILDWVPSHFPSDEFALANFDGTALFEHPDPRRGFQPDWNSLIFDYGRPEVRAFLISSARFWLEYFHADGLRVDAVASMLYRDYSRNEGEWEPNHLGGRENLEAAKFLQDLNSAAYRHHPDIHMIAEESTAWPGVTKAVHDGGLGFGLKWDMGWMHDALEYFERDPIHRQFHHREITFRSNWASSENFMLPLSHDEVVHGKGSLYSRMPGDDWQRHAGLRLLLGWQWAQPGKKLLFMGAELALRDEWSHESPLPIDSSHPARPSEADQTIEWLRALNRLYRDVPALARGDCDPDGFEWLVGDDRSNSVCAFLRRDPSGQAAPVLVVANFTPTAIEGYEIGVPRHSHWEESLSSDDLAFGGSGVRNPACEAQSRPMHGQEASISLRIPPLGVAFFLAGFVDRPHDRRLAFDRAGPAEDLKSNHDTKETWHE